MPPRVLITEAAAGLVRQLQDRHGPLLFHQSGGCCEGSAPMCLRRGDFRVGARDVLLGAQLLDQIDRGGRGNHAGHFFCISHHMPSLKR